MRAVLYARYSTEMQSAASITDQHRAVREALPRLGLRESGAFSDAAISGASWARPGLEAALAEIEAGRADVLFSEALDRISRDLEHVARIAKRVHYRGARIITLSEGEISALHIGLSGTMAQLYVEQLAEKTRRGLAGVVADGRIPTGPAYGYRPTGEAGRFEIVPEAAEVVRRIMRRYAAGVSPRAIAHELNAQNIPGPRGGPWRATTIAGDRVAGTGILNNRLYIGEIIWNRSTWRKDPITGRRKDFPLPEDQWQRADAPHLRLVDDALWESVRLQQGDLVRRGKVRRPTRPLSGLVVCGGCGHAMTMLGRDRYGCQVHKEQGASRCGNGRTAAAADVEARVLDGLREHLCRPDRIERFARAYVEERQRLRASMSGRTKAIEQELGAIVREQAQITATIGRVDPEIVDGLVARLNNMAARKRELQAELEAMPGRDEVIDITRVSANYLSRNLTRLWQELTARDGDGQGSRALRALISRVIMHPESERGRYSLEIEGDAAAFMGLTEDDEASLQKLLVAGAGSDHDLPNAQVKMVAGTRFSLNLLTRSAA